MHWKITFLFKNQNVLFPLLLHYANSYIKGGMERADIEGTHWWRVCVAAGWISHPCLFSFAISTDAKRIEAESPCFLETWPSITLFSALVVFDDLLSSPKLLVGGTRVGGGGGGGGGCDGYLCLMWPLRWKNSRGASSSSVSLCVKSALCCSHLISRKCMWSCTCMKSVPWKGGHWPICALRTSSKYFCCFFTAVIYGVVVTPHI